MNRRNIFDNCLMKKKYSKQANININNKQLNSKSFVGKLVELLNLIEKPKKIITFIKIIGKHKISANYIMEL